MLNDARYEERTEEIGLCNCCFKRYAQFIGLWRHMMGLLANKKTGGVEGSSPGLI